jgi:hypothetical protein
MYALHACGGAFIPLHDPGASTPPLLRQQDMLISPFCALQTPRRKPRPMHHPSRLDSPDHTQAHATISVTRPSHSAKGCSAASRESFVARVNDDTHLVVVAHGRDVIQLHQPPIPVRRGPIVVLLREAKCALVAVNGARLDAELVQRGNLSGARRWLQRRATVRVRGENTASRGDPARRRGGEGGGGGGAPTPPPPTPTPTPFITIYDE